MITYTFDQFIEYGIAHGAKVVDDMPRYFQFYGCAAMHETDEHYLIHQGLRTLHLRESDVIQVKDGQLEVMPAASIIDLNEVFIDQLVRTYVEVFGPLPVEVYRNDIEAHVLAMVKAQAKPGGTMINRDIAVLNTLITSRPGTFINDEMRAAVQRCLADANLLHRIRSHLCGYIENGGGEWVSIGQEEDGDRQWRITIGSSAHRIRSYHGGSFTEALRTAIDREGDKS